MLRSEEIEYVEHWRMVWWDTQDDCEFTGMASGTILNHLERRRVQNIYGLPIHKNCGGEPKIIGECGHYTTLKVRCLKCNKEFCAEV